MVAKPDEASFLAPALLARARVTPQRTLLEGHALLERVDRSDNLSRAIALRAMSIAARTMANNLDSISYAEKSVVEAELGKDLDIRSLSLVTLAGCLALGGRNDEALLALEKASSTSDSVAAEIDFQRGAVFSRMGDFDGAMASYAMALPVFRANGNEEALAKTLNNTGLLFVFRGDFAGAQAALTEARQIYSSLGEETWAAGSEHNLGMVASYRGDIPEALRLFDQSEQRLSELLGSAAEVQVSRVEALLSAGLFREALALATDIAATLHSSGLGEDEAEARLVGAQAALLAGDVDSALRWADIAAQMFEQQDREVWEASARLVGIQAQYEAGLVSTELMLEARRIASILEAEDQMVAAFNARLTAGRMGLELGLLKTALGDLETVSRPQVGPVELGLQSRLARALLRLADRDPGGAAAAAGAGMRLLDEYQAALGATDIRSGVERHGASLGELGLRLALDSGRPRRVFSWMERTRARALRHRPVTPVDDQAQAADLAELRRVSVEMRAAEGDAAQDLSRQERALQESIRNRGRTARGAGSATSTSIPDLIDRLGSRTLVEFASLDDRLWAVVVRNGRFSLDELGSEPSVLTELESFRFTMRRLARRRGNASTELAQQVAARLDEMLFGKLRTGTGSVVIVPTPALHSMPWAALPIFERRAFTVAPSAELWWRAVSRRRRPGWVVVAAGPDLAHAGAEASEVADIYTGVEAIDPDGATVERLRNLLDRAKTGHIACHARFEVDNPMFSSLRLADGDLNVYDLERMRRVPDLVVLSACDSGFSETHPGEELMGLSSALLSLGAKSLVASVGLVPDSEATRELMVGLHRGINRGLGPAEALNRAQGLVRHTTAGYIAAASFVCIGAG